MLAALSALANFARPHLRDKQMKVRSRHGWGSGHGEFRAAQVRQIVRWVRCE